MAFVKINLLFVLIALSTYGSRVCGQNVATGLPQNPDTFKYASKNVLLSAVSKSMSEILKELNSQTGVSFVCDDVSHVKTASFDFKGALKDALKKISDVYDYQWEVSKSGIVMMRKRFFQIDNYPSVNLPELKKTVNEMQTILNRFGNFSDPNLAMHVTLTDLMNSLSLDQMQILKSGGYIRSSALSEAQFSQVRLCFKSALSHNLSAKLGDVENLLNYLPSFSIYYYRSLDPDPSPDFPFPTPKMMVLQASYPRYDSPPLAAILTLRFIPLDPKLEEGYRRPDGAAPEIKSSDTPNGGKK